MVVVGNLVAHIQGQGVGSLYRFFGRGEGNIKRILVFDGGRQGHRCQSRHGCGTGDFSCGYFHCGMLTVSDVPCMQATKCSRHVLLEESILPACCIETDLAANKARRSWLKCSICVAAASTSPS